MTTIIFSKLCGPTMRDAIPSPAPFSQWTYMYHDKKWYWLYVSMRSTTKVGQRVLCKQWVRVPKENLIPKEHKLYVLLLG